MSKVITQKRDNILIVSINRPDVRNAVDGETADLLCAVFEDFNKNDDFKIAVLTGEEGVFCSGADLKAIATDREKTPKLQVGKRSPLGLSELRLSKPVIAAVEGYAVAGGLELALWCDMRVAAEDAIFGVYCRRFGVPLVDGGTIRLPRLIGHSHAMDLILTGRGVHGDEAKVMGLANRITPKGKALEHAIELARSIADFPQLCMRSDRMSAIEQWDLSETEAIKNEIRRGVSVLESGETIAGAKQFMKGRY